MDFDQEKIKLLFKQYKFIIVPLVCSAVALLVIIGVIVPNILEFTKVQQQISDLQATDQLLLQKVESLSLIDENKSTKELRTVFTVLPADRDVPGTLVVLQEAMSRAGLSLQSTKYVASSGLTDKEGFQFNITVIGPLQALNNFISQLESTQRVFLFDSINAQFQRGGTIVEAQMPVLAFYQPAKNIPVSATQPVPKLTDTETQLLSQLQRAVPNIPAIVDVSPSSPSLNSDGSISVDDFSNIPLGKSDPFQ